MELLYLVAEVQYGMCTVQLYHYCVTHTAESGYHYSP